MHRTVMQAGPQVSKVDFEAALFLRVHPESFGVPWAEYSAWLKERDWNGDERRRDWSVREANRLNEVRIGRNARGRDTDDVKAMQMRKAMQDDGLSIQERRDNERARFMAAYRLRVRSRDPDAELRQEVQEHLRREGVPENAVKLRTSGARLDIDARRLGLI